MTKSKIPKQIVGNAGLYYICYELSKRGWNVLPTTRNTKGVDIVIYSQNAKRSYTVQVKALREKNPVSLGSTLNNLFADYLIVCRNVIDGKPEIFIIKIDEIKNSNLITKRKSKKNGKISYWLQINDYEKFKDNWKIIGEGYD